MDRPHTTSSVSGSEFSAASYQTTQTDVSEDVKNRYRNYYQYAVQPPAQDSEDESESESDSDGSDESESDDSEESDSDEEDPYSQWREYYANMYRSSMYNYMPYMMPMNNPYMWMNGQMQMNPMMNMGQMNMGQMNMNSLNPMMNMMNQMNQMNQMNPMGQMGQGQMGQMQMGQNQEDTNMNNMNMMMMMMNMMNNMNMNNGMNSENMTSQTTSILPQTTSLLPQETNPQINSNIVSLDKSSEENISPVNPENDVFNVSEKQEAIERTLSKLSLSQLVENSRKLTIKSNRFPSVPSSTIERDRKRVASLDSNFKSSETKDVVEEPEDLTSLRPVNFGLLELAKEPEEPEEQKHEQEQPEEPEENEPEEQEEDANTTVKYTKKAEISELNLDIPERQNSSSSTKSFDSIATGSSANFHISNQKPPTPPPKTPDQTMETISKQTKKKTKKSKKKSKKTIPPSPGSNFNSSGNFTTPNRVPQNAINISPDMNMMGMNMSPMNMNMPGNRQSIMAPEINRQSVLMNPNMNMPIHQMMSPITSPHMMPQNQIPQMPIQQVQQAPPRKPLDPEIQQKVQQFKHLRSIIASGNKSYEYRLKWVKMLIKDVNFRLYSYINIKGESIHANESHMNKELFIKSATQHIQKLIKEAETSTKISDEIKSDIFLTYANLLSHHYTIYGQDFNMQRDISTSINYYEKSISRNGLNYKAYYTLGDVYEYELNDFEKAVSHYKHSAKLGYNRAIYKMALIYLNIPNYRSVKFIKILRDLCAIEVEKTELDDDDKEELSEIIGFAAYELGKIYEGVYPGDLTVESEFVNKCLEIVPVNYAKALTYYNKSAKLNCPLTLVKLGNVYEYGELNRPQNPGKSIQWYLKAVSSPLPFRRNPDAMIGLSRWYLRGTNGESKHIPQANPERALKWCERAIKEYNSSDAYFQMGQLAEAGLTSQPPSYWYEQAAQMNHPNAIEYMNSTNV